VSLISDALRKARREATERGDHRKSVVVPATVIERPGRVGSGVLVGAVVAVAAALVGASVAWWLLAGRVAPDHGGAPHGESSKSAASAAPDLEPPIAEQDLGAAPGPPTAGGSLGEPEGTESSDIVAPAGAMRSEPVTERPDSESASETTAEERIGPRNRERHAGSGADGSGGRIFVVDADLGDLQLTLDYIIYRPSDPFAQINGVEVHVGDSVAGFAVEEITRDHVLLRDAEGALELRVR
jgi:hypothetical protein